MPDGELSGAVDVERSGDDVLLVFRAGDGEGEAARMETRIHLFEPNADAALPEAKRRSSAPTGVATPPLGHSLVAAFCRLSGDDNPIHASDAAARAIGLERGVVPGLLLAAMAEQALEDADAGPLALLRCRFATPVYIGDRIHLDVRKLPSVGEAAAARWRVVLRDRHGQIASFAEATRF